MKSKTTTPHTSFSPTVVPVRPQTTSSSSPRQAKAAATPVANTNVISSEILTVEKVLQELSRTEKKPSTHFEAPRGETLTEKDLNELKRQYTPQEIERFRQAGLTVSVLKKLANPKEVEFSASESVLCIQSCIQMSQAEFEKARGKDIVLIIGETGTGKSTVVNYLSGCKMEPRKEGGRRQVIVSPSSPIREIMPIGHTDSKTLIPQIHSHAGGPTFCDCPGFFDDRGAEINISNAVNIKNLVKSARSVRILILLSYKTLEDKRGIILKRIRETVDSLLGKKNSLVEFKAHLLIGITKVPLKDEDEQPLIDKDVHALLFDSASNNEKSLPQELRQQTLLIDPLGKRDSEGYALSDCIKAIEGLTPLPTDTCSFNTVLSAEDRVLLVKISRATSEQITQNLQQKDFNVAYRNLQYMKYLMVIGQPEVTQLYEDNLNEINRYFRQELQNTRELSERFQCQLAETSINQLLSFVRLFREFTPKIQDDLLEVVQFNIIKYIEKSRTEIQKLYKEFNSLYYQNTELQKKTAYQIHQILNVGSVPIDSLEAKTALPHFLTDLAEIPEFREKLSQVQQALKSLQNIIAQVNQPEVYENETGKLLDELQKMAQSAHTLHNDMTIEALTKIKLALLQIMPIIKTKIIWKNNGPFVLECLADLIANNIGTILTNLLKDPLLKQDIQCVHSQFVEANKNILTLTDEHELKNLSQDVIYQNLSDIKSQLLQEKKAEETTIKLEQERNEVTAFIQNVEKILGTKSFDQIHSIFTKMAHFTPHQRNVLKNDTQLGTTLRFEIEDAFKLLQSKLLWKLSGLDYLKIYETVMSTSTDVTASLSILKKLINTPAMNSVKGILQTLETLFQCTCAFAEMGNIKMKIFSPIFRTGFDTIKAQFVKEQEQEHKEALRQEAQSLITTINQRLIPNDQFKEVKVAFLRLRAIAPEQIGSIALAARVRSLIESFKNLLHKSQDYVAVKQKLSLLETIKKNFAEFLDDLTIKLDINALKMEICNCVAAQSEAAKGEILAAFDFDALADINAPLKEIHKLDELFQLVKQYENLDTILEYRERIVTLSRTKITEIFKRYNTEKNAEAYAKLLMQTQLLINVVGSKDSNLAMGVSQFVTYSLQALGDDYEFLARVDERLAQVSSDGGKDSEYARSVISEYPEFKNAQNVVHIEKTKARRAANIIGELQGDINKDCLKSVYAQYEKEYEGILLKINGEYGPDDKSILLNCVIAARQNGLRLVNMTNYDSNRENVALMLANIFGAWAYLDAHDGAFRPNHTLLRFPHSSQIVALFLLFGLGTGKPFQNHLIEIKTGEGKSVVAAGAAIAFALIGFMVDVACYSPYLAHRDQAAFANLINAFQIDNEINYGDFGDISNTCLKAMGDPRELTQSFLKGENYSLTSSGFSKRRLLFVDEVDVLFSENYLGKTYNPAFGLMSSAYKALLLEIWDQRQEYAKLSRSAFMEKVRNHQQMIAFCREYPRIEHLITEFIGDIYIGFTNVHGNSHQYICKNGDIGYIDTASNVIRFHSFQGPSTSFAAVKEFRNKNIQESALDNKVKLMILVGNVSYAELPKQYAHIIGVTGTLFPLGQYENTLLAENNIVRKTTIPTVFTHKKKLPDESPIKICGGARNAQDTQGYFASIMKYIEDEIIYKDRAGLVLFETEELLQAYHAECSGKYKYKTKITNLLCAATPNKDRDLVIKEAAKRGQVTLMVSAYGRGSDFVCHDDALRAKGGVGVICTFFPKNRLEEIQYKGRTCRQNDPGTFTMILHLDDLEWLGVTTQSQLEKTGKSVYAALNELRVKKLDEQGKELARTVVEAKDKHNKTVQLLKSLSVFANNKSKMVEQEIQQTLLSLNS